MAGPPDDHLRDAVRLAAWKKQLLAKGVGVAKALEDLLAKKDVDLASLRAPLLPEKDPETRLRRFLDLIDRRIKAFETGAWGRCVDCGAAIDEITLDNGPWTERCPKHASLRAT